jgi:hypothetical protein
MLRKEQVADWLDIHQLDPSLADLHESSAAPRPVEVARNIGNWLLRSFQYPCSNEAAVIWAHWHITNAATQPESGDKT